VAIGAGMWRSSVDHRRSTGDKFGSLSFMFDFMSVFVEMATLILDEFCVCGDEWR
jgi:hypothetical protein